MPYYPTERGEGRGKRARVKNKKKNKKNVCESSLHSLLLKGSKQIILTWPGHYCIHVLTHSHTYTYSGFHAGCPDEVWWPWTRIALLLDSMVCFSSKICLVRGERGEGGWPEQGAASTSMNPDLYPYVFPSVPASCTIRCILSPVQFYSLNICQFELSARLNSQNTIRNPLSLPVLFYYVATENGLFGKPNLT